MKKIFIITIFLNYIFSMTGIDLAKLVDNRPVPYDIKSVNTMIITNKKGREKTLELVTKSKDNSKRQMIWFLSPPDDKGMSFLKIEHDDKDDLMKMWLPGFKKLRRISSTKKSDSFMGSDLSFEDLTNRNINSYNYNLISDSSECEYRNNSMPCYELESIPNINSEYSRHITWIIDLSGVYLAIKEHSFDKKGDLLKTKSIEFKEFRPKELDIIDPYYNSTTWKMSDIYYIMNKLDIKNVQKNTSTSLKVNNIEFNLGIEDSDFNEMNLKRLPK